MKKELSTGSKMDITPDSYASKNNLFEKLNSESLINPTRLVIFVLSLFWLAASIYEERLFSDLSRETLPIRLLTITGFALLFGLSFVKFIKKNIVLVIHSSILLATGSVFLLAQYAPQSLAPNSYVLGIVIFTSALFLSWDPKHQIVLAIYYMLLFVFTLLFSKNDIILSPNFVETIIIVIGISVLAVASSMLIFHLRKSAVFSSMQSDESEKRYKDIFDNSLEGIFHCTKSGELLTVNKAFASLLGYKNTEDLLDFNISSDVFYDPGEFQRMVNELEKETRKNGLLVKLKKSTSSKIFVRINARKFYNDKNDNWYIEGFAQDITEQQIAETERKNVLEELHKEKLIADRLANNAIETNLLKSRFLAKVNHEIRTPINSILGFFTLIEEGLYQSKEELSSLFFNARSAANSMLEIIDSNLDMAKVEAGNIQLNSIDFNIVEQIKNSLLLLESKLNEKRIRIKFHYDRLIDKGVRGDATKFRQILINLINNSIKAVEEEGEISISVSQSYVGTDLVDTYITVEDNGVGIPEEIRDHLFNPFIQGNSSQSGAGLGLLICKEFVELMNGHIEVQSVIGQGTIFSFAIPFKRIEYDMEENMFIHSEKEETEPNLDLIQLDDDELFTEAKPDKPILLLVEDNKANRTVEKRLLENIGYTILTASDGIEAIGQIESKYLDLILMDIEMPGMDGLTATKKIRAMESPKKDIPIIAVTAHASMQDRQRCIDAGMDDYISKPINIQFMKMIIQKWLSNKSLADSAVE
ncbi:MAG: response regulator [Melioribacteraceae bacterium]|nr:response regulator [Melioribacteraceae bacterium]